jgi:hypothetical protein
MGSMIELSESQKTLLNCIAYNELLMLEDRITYPCTPQDQREEIIKEIFDLKDLLLKLKGEQ